VLTADEEEIIVVSLLGFIKPGAFYNCRFNCFRVLCLGCHISASSPSLLTFFATVLDWVPFRILLAQVSQFVCITGSLWRHQSQQSFHTLTPFNFLFYSLHVSAPTGHPQVRYTISYLKDYFNTTDPLHVRNLIIGMLFVVIGISTCSSNTCYQIKYKK
jgi:hypothetical protein